MYALRVGILHYYFFFLNFWLYPLTYWLKKIKIISICDWIITELI